MIFDIPWYWWTIVILVVVGLLVFIHYIFEAIIGKRNSKSEESNEKTEAS